MSDVLEQTPCPGDAMVQTLKELVKADRGQISLEEGLKIARSTSFTGADPSLAILFLRMWANLSCLTRNVLQLISLHKRAMELTNAATPPEVRAMAGLLEIIAVRTSGNHVRAEELFREIFKYLHPDSPHYTNFFLNHALTLAEMGRGVEMEEQLTDLLAKRSAHTANVSRTLFAHYLEAGRSEAAKVLLSDAVKDPRYGVVQSDHLNRSRALIALMQGGASPPEGKDFGEIRALEHLLARRPQEALAAARDVPDGLLEAYHTSPSFYSFMLIRAELSSGHGEAARRLLKIRRDIGNQHPLDGFFLARVELLAGNEPAAARHFAAAMRNVEKYRLEPRLEFELRLSCEMSPADPMRLVRAAKQAPRAEKQEPAPTPHPTPPRGLARLVGNSRAMETLRRAILRFAPLDAPVLITGETGTGKEEVANAIHESGPRAAEPFVAVNCGAIAESLLESELFGHERGSFTGAERARRGLFEEAGRGTILLDEIGEISPRLQVALLRVLEASEVRPVGSSRSRKVACRIIAATNADLAAIVSMGGLRQDLLFRLRRLEIFIPPLRERRDDILPLADHFLCQERVDARRPAMSEELKAELRGREWPGNVRELKSAIERMRLLNSDKLAYEAPDVGPGPAPAAAAPPAPTPGAPDGSDAAERPGPSDRAAVENAIYEGRSSLRRRDRLRDLFRRHGKLTRQEITRLLSVSGPTATADLKALCTEGLVEKVMPTASPGTHYFRLKVAGAQEERPAGS